MDDVEIHFEESWGALQTLIQEGKVRYGGLSNHPVALMERVLALGPIASNQHQYNLLNREIERDVLPFSQEHNIGVLCWSPLASGFLVDTFDLEVLDPRIFVESTPLLRNQPIPGSSSCGKRYNLSPTTTIEHYSSWQLPGY